MARRPYSASSPVSPASRPQSLEVRRLRPFVHLRDEALVVGGVELRADELLLVRRLRVVGADLLPVDVFGDGDGDLDRYVPDVLEGRIDAPLVQVRLRHDAGERLQHNRDHTV